MKVNTRIHILKLFLSCEIFRTRRWEYATTWPTCAPPPSLAFSSEEAAIVFRLQKSARVVIYPLAPLRGVGSSFSSQLRGCLSCCDKLYQLFLGEPPHPPGIRAGGRERLMQVPVCSLGGQLVLALPHSPYPAFWLQTPNFSIHGGSRLTETV